MSPHSSSSLRRIEARTTENGENKISFLLGFTGEVTLGSTIELCIWIVTRAVMKNDWKIVSRGKTLGFGSILCYGSKILMDSKFHGEQRIIRNLACMQLKEVIIKNNLTDIQTVFVIFEVCKYERTSPYIVFRCHAMLNSLTSPPWFTCT